MTCQKIDKLVLHPHRATFSLTSWEKLVPRLQEVDFLGEPLGATLDEQLDSPLNASLIKTANQPLDKARQNRFLVGERFLQYITFMGCSPAMELEPPNNGSLNFCHIHFSEINPEAHFRSTSQNVIARCPLCRKRLNNWKQALSTWSRDSSAVSFNCDMCSEPISLHRLDWRHTAGFARLFIDLYSIYPQEGIPTDPFLSLLETVTGEQWGYFFTDQ